MAFTAKLLEAEKRGASWKLKLEFADGADIAVRNVRFDGTTVSQLKRFVRQQATKLADVKTADFSALVGKTMDLTVATAVVKTPTAAEIAKTNWFKDWRRLNKMVDVTNLLPALATIQTNKAITDLRNKLETGWLNSYLGDI